MASHCPHPIFSCDEQLKTSLSPSVRLSVTNEFFFRLKSYNGVSRMFKGCFNEVLRMFHASFKYRNFEGCFKIFRGLSKKIEGCFEGVLRMFHGHFKEVLMLFSGCFKEN